MRTSPSQCPPASDSFVPLVSCAALCATATTPDELNRDCFCIAVDPAAVQDSLARTMAEHDVPAALGHSHANLFAGLPVYLRATHVDAIERFADDLEVAVARPAYRDAVLRWAPEIAQLDPGSPGGLLGLDFHLGPDGPQLIEINTNPGGVLLNALMAGAQTSCMPERVRTVLAADEVEDRVFASLQEEWRLQRGAAPLRRIAIVDDAPRAQYLYPEFLLYRSLLQRHGVDAVICAPAELQRIEGAVLVAGERVDMVYNRLTDFPLGQPGHAMLRSAYRAGEIALTPHPRAHALYADKRNLTLLGDRDFLLRAGCSLELADRLARGVPSTVFVDDQNRAALWDRRGEYFFKPAAGFGSRASYRGDKLTRRVWDEIARAVYVAQRLVAPGLRRVSPSEPPLKVYIRCYAYRGRTLLLAARMYQGQTTNFRTPGGGFAPVFTWVDPKVQVEGPRDAEAKAI